MKLSKFGQKFTGSSGILQLMDDLGQAMAGDERVLMLGGGNPAHIPAVEDHFRQRMEHILETEGEFERMTGNYGAPQGERKLNEALASLLRREFGWELGADNIAITNSSQNAFFCLLNMFAGASADGRTRKILLPLAPEYIGYVDLGLTEDFFVASKPEFELIDEHTFKYHVDFDRVFVTDEIGAICVSRPTNPTGNVLTEAELAKLSRLAQAHNIPLIIDNAYGTPFPNIVFAEEARPIWDQHIILCMSLSKLGLPGVRTGIVIANEEIIAAVSAFNAITGLAPGSFGPELVVDLVSSGEVIPLSREVIRPYYRKRAEQAVAHLRSELQGTTSYIHKAEGAFFLWAWFKDLPITSQALYERLKQRGVLVVPGQYFFPGLHEPWRHKQECIRISYAMEEEIVLEGLTIIAEEVKRAYDN